eukprot:UN03877
MSNHNIQQQYSGGLSSIHQQPTTPTYSLHLTTSDDLLTCTVSNTRLTIFILDVAPLLTFIDTNNVPANNEIIKLHYNQGHTADFIYDAVPFPNYPFVALIGDGQHNTTTTSNPRSQ